MVFFVDLVLLDLHLIGRAIVASEVARRIDFHRLVHYLPFVRIGG